MADCGIRVHSTGKCLVNFTPVACRLKAPSSCESFSNDDFGDLGQNQRTKNKRGELRSKLRLICHYDAEEKKKENIDKPFLEYNTI